MSSKKRAESVAKTSPVAAIKKLNRQVSPSAQSLPQSAQPQELSSVSAYPGAAKH